MISSPLFKEAKRLHDFGFAIHWLMPKEKRPIESGWTSGPRKEWNYLRETYIDGLNVGVRLGAPSKLGDGYLAVVDVDVKSGEKRHRAEALRAASELLGVHGSKCPVVLSGRGNGSRHYYCVTARPFKTWNPAKSSDVVKVSMPSVRPSKKEIETLSAKEIGEGIRLRPAWDISLYSDGRQVVLPPSIHPDSGKPYTWAKPWTNLVLPLVEFEKPAAAPGVGSSPASLKEMSKAADEFEASFEFPVVDLEWLPISEGVRLAIMSGEGVSDRSGYLLQAVTALHSAGLGQNEILSVLTDVRHWLSACAYEHAKTKSRVSAARWLLRYTVKKVLAERDPSGVFDAPVEVKKLSGDALAAQNLEFESQIDWRSKLIRTGQKGEGPPKSCVENVILILKNAVDRNVIRRDLFAGRDSYSIDTPWGGKEGKALTDDDIALIKYWLGRKFRFEPSSQVIFDALVVLALDSAYDPVCDWVDGLPKWDGVKRLGSWLRDNFQADGNAEYLNQVFTKWLVAMIGRAKHPGLKFDWFPIFEGAQGMGKSSFGRILVGDKYFLDQLPNLADKDAALALQGIWCVEMGELANMRKTEIEVVKAFITRTVDKARPPYGRKWLESPRRCVFFGTTNRSTYLTDDTGNRRIKPVKVGKLDFEKLRAEREQLFSEALTIWNEVKENSRYFELTGEALKFEAEIHQDKMVADDSDLMVEQLFRFIKQCLNNEQVFNFDKFKMIELFEGTGPFRDWSLNARNAQFAGKALKKLGGENWKSDGNKVWKIANRDRFLEDLSLDFY